MSVIVLPKQYVESKAALGRYENSPDLPSPVISAVRDFDMAVGDNAENLRKVLNSALQKDRNYILKYDDDASPQYFHQTDAMWLDNFIQLRPKADAIRDAIRKYLGVK